MLSLFSLFSCCAVSKKIKLRVEIVLILETTLEITGSIRSPWILARETKGATCDPYLKEVEQMRGLRLGTKPGSATAQTAHLAASSLHEFKQWQFSYCTNEIRMWDRGEEDTSKLPLSSASEYCRTHARLQEIKLFGGGTGPHTTHHPTPPQKHTTIEGMK